MILRSVKHWRAASLVYHTESKQKINEKWTEYKPISIIGPGFESDGNARERRSRSFLYNGNVVPVVFFCILQLLTVIFHGSPSVIKLIRLFPAFMHVNNNDSDICVYVYDIMDNTSAMWDNWPIGSWHTQNCFSTLFYTPYTNIKISAQNAPKCTIARQKIKKFSLEGHSPLPQIPSQLGRGIPPRFSCLRRSAFPFLFIYDSNTT